MKFIVVSCIVLLLFLVGIFFIVTPQKSNKKQVRFDSNVKVGTIYGDKMDRFNPDLKSLFEKNIKEASLVGGSKNLARMSMSEV